MDGSLLVGQVQTGSATDFAQLFRAHHGPLTNYLYHLLHSREVADDLAQETFLKAYRALYQTPPEVPFRAWLYRIATNTCTGRLLHPARLSRSWSGRVPGSGHGWSNRPTQPTAPMASTSPAWPGGAAHGYGG